MWPPVCEPERVSPPTEDTDGKGPSLTIGRDRQVCGRCGDRVYPTRFILDREHYLQWRCARCGQVIIGPERRRERMG